MHRISACENASCGQSPSATSNATVQPLTNVSPFGGSGIKPPSATVVAAISACSRASRGQSPSAVPNTRGVPHATGLLPFGGSERKPPSSCISAISACPRASCGQNPSAVSSPGTSPSATAVQSPFGGIVTKPLLHCAQSVISACNPAMCGQSPCAISDSWVLPHTANVPFGGSGKNPPFNCGAPISACEKASCGQNPSAVSSPVTVSDVLALTEPSASTISLLLRRLSAKISACNSELQGQACDASHHIAHASDQTVVPFSGTETKPLTHSIACAISACEKAIVSLSGSVVTCSHRAVAHITNSEQPAALRGPLQHPTPTLMSPRDVCVISTAPARKSVELDAQGERVISKHFQSFPPVINIPPHVSFETFRDHPLQTAGQHSGAGPSGTERLSGQGEQQQDGHRRAGTSSVAFRDALRSEEPWNADGTLCAGAEQLSASSVATGCPSLRIATWNVQVNITQTQLCNLLQSKHSVAHAKLICLQEVQLNQRTGALHVPLKTHHVYYSTFPALRRQAIVVHNSLLKHICGHTASTAAAAVEFDTFVLFSVHLKHRSEQQLVDMLGDLSRHISTLRALQKPIILAGD